MKRQSRQEAVLDVYQITLAAVLFASPLAVRVRTQRGIANARISGVLVALVSGLALLMFREWEEWINVILGAWIMASPWILGFPHTTAAHVMVTVGIVITYLALLEIWLAHNRTYYSDRPDQTQHS